MCPGPAPSPSHHAPNIQTSLAVVKRLKLMDSGDIHLMGRRVMDAAGGEADGGRARGCRGAEASPWPPRAPLTFIILLVLDVPGEPEVPQLHALRGGHQDVPHRDVPARRDPWLWRRAGPPLNPHQPAPLAPQK